MRKAIYQDRSILCTVEDDDLRFSNGVLHLGFDDATGALRELRVDGAARSLVAATPYPVSADVDGRPFLGGGARLVRRTVAPGRRFQGVSLSFTFVPEAASDAELTVTYRLRPAASRLEIAAHLRAGAGQARLEGFRFLLPGVLLDHPADCTVRAPGPWFPATYLGPRAAYLEWADREVGLHSAPDAGFGLLAVVNQASGQTLGAWVDTGGETNVRPTLRGSDGLLSFVFDDRRCYRLTPGVEYPSDVLHVVVASAWPDLLEQYSRRQRVSLGLDPWTPDWVRDMVLLEVYPDYYRGGFREITERLPYYREIGFNAIYLMPHWLGGYSPIDPFEVDPKYGTKDDLAAMVAGAHELEMHVLFDMVIHGFGEKSRLPRERPGMFCRNEDGTLARHPTWKSVTTDWASPVYRDYMQALVRHDVQTYGIDGYRVDAASFKGPNWDPSIPYPAYRSGASVSLLEAIIETLRESKHDGVLLSEVFGPAFHGVCNLAHDNQAEAPQHFLEMVAKGTATAADYREHIADVRDMLPEGANRVFFGRNHDTSWFYHFGGYTPQFLAIEAIHAFCGIPEVFAGDHKHGPKPDADAPVWPYYRSLFALRRQHPEIVEGSLLLCVVGCDNPMVFAAARETASETSLLAVSLSDEPQTAAIHIAQHWRGGGLVHAIPCEDRAATSVTLTDVATGELVPAPSSAGAIHLDLGPCQAVLGRVGPRAPSASPRTRRRP